MIRKRTRATSFRTLYWVSRRFSASHLGRLRGLRRPRAFEGKPIELKLPLDTSVYDGKLKRYHQAQSHEPCYVAVVVRRCNRDSQLMAACVETVRGLFSLFIALTLAVLVGKGVSSVWAMDALSPILLELIRHFLGGLVGFVAFMISLGTLVISEPNCPSSDGVGAMPRCLDAAKRLPTRVRVSMTRHQLRKRSAAYPT